MPIFLNPKFQIEIQAEITLTKLEFGIFYIDIDFKLEFGISKY